MGGDKQAHLQALEREGISDRRGVAVALFQVVVVSASVIKERLSFSKSIED